jgi:F-type H+-transporting ATPase subunit b
VAAVEWIAMLAEAAPADGGEEPLFDWVIFIAQIVNFLILVALLRIFLYKRVIQAMDRRLKKIASHFESAEQKEAEADEKKKELEEEKAELERKRDSLMEDAREEADERRRKLLDQARAEVDEQARRWREDLAREKDAFAAELRSRAARQISAIARRALADLADADLERRMAKVLLARLAGLDEEERGEFAGAVRAGGEGVTVASAWDVPEEERSEIADAIRETFDGEAEVRFETAPELSCGVELRAGGREIAWTVDEYVRDLADDLAAAVDEEVKEAEPAKKSSEEQGEKPANEKGEPADEKQSAGEGDAKSTDDDAGKGRESDT